MAYLYYTFLFLLGGQAYCTLELIWRGRTHYSMFFAGGIIFLLLIAIEHNMKKAPLSKKCFYGASAITLIEFIFGCVFNLALNMGVWDYSNQPLNILGQICALYSVLWFLLCFALFKWIIKNNFNHGFI